MCHNERQQKVSRAWNPGRGTGNPELFTKQLKEEENHRVISRV
jgi:hypothetical protein